MLITQLCLILCDPMDCSLPGSSVHGILQVRIMGCIAISSSRDLTTQVLDPGLLHCGRFFLYHLSHLAAHCVNATYFLITAKYMKGFFLQSFPRTTPSQANYNQFRVLFGTNSFFFFLFFSVFIVLSINHLKQTVSSWKLKMNLFIFPLHLMSLFLTHWRTITWLQKVLIDLLS